VIDPAAVERLRKLGGDELIARMIELFFSYAEPKVALARASLEAGELEAAGRAAHSLKSSAGNLGAQELALVSSDVEAAAMKQDGTEVLRLLEDLEAAFARAKARLEELRRGLAK
jgi:HPt (histidine-containing phosphotransfer) domain-containing protein